MSKIKYHIFARDTQVSLFPICMIVDVWNTLYPKKYGIRPKIGFIDRKKQVEYFLPQKDWREMRAFFIQKIKTSPNFLFQLIKKIERAIDNLNNFTEKYFYQKDLSRKTNKELFRLYKRLYELDTVCYALGNPMFVLEFGEGYFSSQIKKILKEHLHDKNKEQEYFTILTTSPRPTLNYQENLALLKLATELNKKGAWRKIKNLPDDETLEIVKKQEPHWYKKLKNHREKFVWIFYNWEGPALPIKDFFLNIKDILTRSNPSHKLKEKLEELQKLKKDQEKILKELKFTNKEKQIVAIVQETAYWQLYRKTRQFKSMWHCETLLEEIGKRLFISKNQVRFLLKNELKQALSKNEINTDILNERYRLLVYHYKKDVSVILSDRKAENFVKDNVLQEKGTKGLKELRGTPIYTGLIKGRVRIINTIEQAREMKKGEILVSYATAPTLVPAMRLASAIVTQEGGLTCHAAIVSRELQIPSIVGINHLLTNIKTGDEIEINANKGIVKKVP